MIREFKKSENKKVQDLVSSILQREFEDQSSYYQYGDLSNIADSYGGKRDAFFVCLDGKDIVGTVGIKEDDQDVALLRRIFVDKSYRKKGYGDQLIDKALLFAQEKGFKKMIFHGSEQMIGAINLVVKKGFEQKGVLPFAEHQIYMMEKKI